MRRRGLVDGDDKGDHVGPERDRQCAKRRHEDQRGRVERPSVTATVNAAGQHDCSQGPDRREDEQIWPVDPAMHQREIFGQRVDEDDSQEDEHADREIGYLSPG
jgi:hypothetical protein